MEKDIIVVAMADKPGELHKLTKKLARNGVNIESLFILGAKTAIEEVAISVDRMDQAKDVLDSPEPSPFPFSFNFPFLQCNDITTTARNMNAPPMAVISVGISSSRIMAKSMPNTISRSRMTEVTVAPRPRSP